MDDAEGAEEEVVDVVVGRMEVVVGLEEVVEEGVAAMEVVGATGEAQDDVDDGVEDDDDDDEEDEDELDPMTRWPFAEAGAV